MSALAPQSARPAAPFRTAVDLVRLPVVVVGGGGAPVSDLRVEDFEVYEDGRRHPIASFARGGDGDAVPLHLGLMLDRSVSMERDARAAAGAAVQFVGRLTEARDVTFVEFDTQIRLGRYRPENYPQLFARIREQRSGPGTKLYDALGWYVAGTRGREGVHVLLLYTDGGDSTSDLTLGQVLDILRRGQVLIYAVGYTGDRGGSAGFLQHSVLERLARETGGASFFPRTVRDLDRIYETILREVQGRYTIGYVPSTVSPDGRFRRVEVRVTRPGRGELTVRTRSGYLPRQD
jgi:VWFA-related protein